MEIIINNARCEVLNANDNQIDLLKQICTYRDEGEFFVYLKWKRKQDRMRAMIKRGERYDTKTKREIDLNVKRYYKASHKCLFKDLKKEKSFPTGLLPKVREALDAVNYSYKIVDKRIKPRLLQYKYVAKEPFFPARYYQKEAIETAVSKSRGVIVSPTGSGKSFMINKIIWELGLKTIIIAPSKDIKKMLEESLIKTFGKGKVAALSTRSVKTKQLNIVNIQALTKMNPEVLADIDVMIVDEFHHCLRGSSNLKTDKGVLTIKSIVEKNIDCKVLSYNKELNTWEYRKVLNRFKYDAPEELIELEYVSPTGTKKLICTPNHKIYTSNRGYVLAEYLTTDDDIIVDKGYVCSVCGKYYDNVSGLGGCAVNHTISMDKKIARGRAMSKHPNHNNPEARRKNSISKLGDKNPSKRPEVRSKKSISQKAWWDSMSKEEKDWRIATFQNAPIQGVRKGPTSLERRVINLGIKDLKFTGDGSLWLTSNGKHMNPDFISNNRKVVEVGDVEFWHNQEDISNRITNYRDIKFECLYLTSDQMKLMNDLELKNAIEEFLNG